MKKSIVNPGDRFGRLTVIEEVEQDRHGFRMFKCRCDCGTVKVVRAVSSTARGRAKSCGCLVRDVSTKAAILKNTLPVGEANFRALYATYIDRAKKREMEWSITEDEFKTLTSSSCHYCGSSPSMKMNKNHEGPKKLNGSYMYNGLDRVKQSQGYTCTNVVPCCRQCNVMKWDYSKEEFIDQIKKILSHEAECSKA